MRHNDDAGERKQDKSIDRRMKRKMVKQHLERNPVTQSSSEKRKKRDNLHTHERRERKSMKKKLVRKVKMNEVVISSF